MRQYCPLEECIGHLAYGLKSPYHGFLKMTVHKVWKIALRE